MNARPTLKRRGTMTCIAVTCIAVIAVYGGVSHMQHAHGDDKVQSPARTSSPLLTLVPAKSFVAPDVKVWIAALPRDTETIVQANSFEMATLPDDIGKYDWPTIMEQLTLSPMLDSRVSNEMLQLLSGRSVRWVLYGGRHFKPINSFGSSLGEGACIFLLDKPLGDLRGEIKDALDQEHAAVRAASNREIVAIPPPERRKPNEKWEGTFVVFWDDRTIVVATSEQYLRQLLKGMTSQPETTVIGRPATPYWAAIPPDADAWLVRHSGRQPGAPDGTSAEFLGGIVWALTYKKKSRCSVRYWPADHVKVETLDAKLHERFDEGFRQMSPRWPVSWKMNGGTVELAVPFAEIQGIGLNKWLLMVILNAHIGMDQI
jgi:hypothetical protein